MTHLTTIWIVPPITAGSGGHRTIFNHCNYLSSQGVRVYVSIQGQGQKQDQNLIALKRFIEEHFFSIKFTLINHESTEIEADVAIATFWTTAFDVAMLNIPKKLYFVQDYEPYFYPVGDNHIQCLLTYEMIEAKICIGQWLPSKLRAEGVGGEIGYFNFGCNKKIYFDKKSKREIAVCILFQPEKSRRCPALVNQVVRLLSKESNIKVYCYGSHHKLNIPGVTNLGVLGEEKLAELYNKCTIGFIVSSTNPSRIPFEMLASGLCVIDIASENNCYDYPDNTIVLANPNPRTITDEIVSLLNDKSRQQDLRNNSLAFVENLSTSNEYGMFYTSLINYLDSGSFIHSQTEKKIQLPSTNRLNDSQSASVIDSFANRPKIKSKRKRLDLRKLRAKIKAKLGRINSS